MEAKDFLAIKKSLLECAGGDEVIAKKLHKWLGENIQEFGNSWSYSKADMIPFKTTEEFTDFRKHNVIEMHLQLAEKIHESKMSFLESRPMPGDCLEDRIRIFVLGRP